MRLALIHRAPGSPAPADSTAWRTCLREIHFLSGHRTSADADVLTDAEAYALLLEVVCGLRSPLLGETEVQAQFKQFLAAQAASGDRWIARLGQRVLGDAKRIRHKHLQGFGAHSYGRLTARHLTGGRVAVVGTGALAAQVVLSVPDHMNVDVWGRSTDRILPTRSGSLEFSLIRSATAVRTRQDATTFVVAAPVGGQDLDIVMSRYSAVRFLIDLRSSDQQTSISVKCPVLRLADLLTQATEAEAAGAPRIWAARAEIGALALDFAGREEFRPFGWDDVCA